MTHMQPRIENAINLIPDALKALHAVHASVQKVGLPSATLKLLELRVSQINGCGVCVDMHSRELKRMNEPDERIFGVAAWREMPYFDDRERAALALAESVTRISDRPDPVSDDVWNEAARHYDERELAALVLAIASINVWNRLNVATRQIAGAWTATIKAS